MQEDAFDAIVIGSGQGGTPLSGAMAQHGWRTALIERRAVGGVCLNDGCVPTKTNIAGARVAELARRAEEFGVRRGETSVDMAAVKRRKDELIGRGRASIQGVLAKSDKLELILGEACFAPRQPEGGSHAVEVRLPDGSTRTLAAPRIFLNTGLRPSTPALEGLASVPYLDSTTILDLEEVPRHLVIVGAGYIALEFAQMFRRFGAEVTVIGRGSQILSREDEDVAACLTAVLREDGIEVLLDTTAGSVRAEKDSVSVEISTGKESRVLRGSHLLVATGRTPNTESLHLNCVGIAVSSQGFVDVNEKLETARPGIWALGDIKGGPAYTHVSSADGRLLRANLLEGKAHSTKDRLVPYCVFTDPELGRVGMTEREARQAGADVLVGSIPMSAVARAREMSETRGMLKAVVDKGTGRLLGAAALGFGGGEVATQLQLAMLGGLTVNNIEEAIFTHPVLAEGLHPLLRSVK